MATTSDLLTLNLEVPANFISKRDVTFIIKPHKVTALASAPPGTTLTLVDEHCLEVGDLVAIVGFETCPDEDGVYSITAVNSPTSITINLDSSKRARFSNNAYVAEYQDISAMVFRGEIDIPNEGTFETKDIAGIGTASNENGVVLIQSECTPNIREGDIFEALQGHRPTVASVETCNQGCETTVLVKPAPPNFTDSRWTVTRQVAIAASGTTPQALGMSVTPVTQKVAHHRLELTLPALSAGTYNARVWSVVGATRTLEFNSVITYD